MTDYTNIDLEEMASQIQDFNDMVDKQTELLANDYAERMDKELRGAWRAGYDYLHVYQEHAMHSLAREPLSETFTMSYYVYPSNTDHRPNPPGLQYAYTYDLTSVPDHVIRAAMKGELEDYERLASDE